MPQMSIDRSRLARVAASLATALALLPLSQASATPTEIRVGGPSAPADSKLAIVASDKDLRGQRFSATLAGKTVLSGRLKAAKGSPDPWRHAFVADLSELSDPGAYRLEAGGASSPPWIVQADGSAAGIEVILDYLRTNRDGAEPARLHGPAHLNDAALPDGSPIPISGGWMDAGDMIHFTQTTAATVVLLETAARFSPARASALREESDVGVRWLLRAHPEPGLFIAQVGDARDHEQGFRDPAADDASAEPGIGTRVAYPGVGGDTAGKTAAALALVADRSPEPLRAQLLGAAREWYAAGLAAAAPLGPLGGRSGGFYLTGSWEDDMAGGAAALYRSTAEPAFLEQAEDFLRNARYEAGIDPYSFSTFAAAELCGALGAPAASAGSARDFGCEVLADTGRFAAKVSRRTAFATPGEFTWGQTRLNANAGTAAALAERAGLLPGGEAIAASARDYLLGRNPWGRSFVAGYGQKPAREIHHWAVALAGDGEPRGAVVGGPAPADQVKEQGFRAKIRKFARYDSRRAVYEDHRPNYVTSEPTIDYSAATILMLAVVASG